MIFSAFSFSMSTYITADPLISFLFSRPQAVATHCISLVLSEMVTSDSGCLVEKEKRANLVS